MIIIIIAIIYINIILITPHSIIILIILLITTITTMTTAPTRELALQIKTVITALGDFLNVRIHACVGGTLVR